MRRWRASDRDPFAALNGRTPAVTRSDMQAPHGRAIDADAFVRPRSTAHWDAPTAGACAGRSRSPAVRAVLSATWGCRPADRVTGALACARAMAPAAGPGAHWRAIGYVRTEAGPARPVHVRVSSEGRVTTRSSRSRSAAETGRSWRRRSERDRPAAGTAGCAPSYADGTANVGVARTNPGSWSGHAFGARPRTARRGGVLTR